MDKLSKQQTGGAILGLRLTPVIDHIDRAFGGSGGIDHQTAANVINTLINYDPDKTMPIIGFLAENQGIAGTNAYGTTKREELYRLAAQAAPEGSSDRQHLETTSNRIRSAHPKLFAPQPHPIQAQLTSMIGRLTALAHNRMD